MLISINIKHSTFAKYSIFFYFFNNQNFPVTFSFHFVSLFKAVESIIIYNRFLFFINIRLFRFAKVINQFSHIIRHFPNFKK